MPQTIKVGIFASICLVILAVLIWKIEDINPFRQGGQRIDAVFTSVAGLDDKAAVRVAGVKVGRVDGIRLDGERARVTLLLEKPVRLTTGSRAQIANLGLLGDKYVELIPGPLAGPLLAQGSVLPGETPVSFDQVMAKVNNLGDSLQAAAGQLNSGPGGGGIARLLDSLEATSAEIRALVAENRVNVASTVANFNAVSATLARELPRLADQMNRTVAQISQVVEENRGDLRGSMGNIREVTAKLQTSVDNFNKISDKIATGQGTVGKLVNDEEAYNKVVQTLDSIKGGVDTVSKTLGAVQRFKFDLDMNAYLLKGDSQANLRLDIDPQDEKHLYRAGIGALQSGVKTVKTQQFTTTLPDGSKQVTTVQNLTTENSKLLSALFGYRAPHDIRLWAGLFEGSGGVQAEIPWKRHDLLFSLDAFDFNREQDKRAHLRFTTRWQFSPSLYLIGGYDDPLENKSLFLGGGVRWGDDNLKYLLGSIPKF